jgi:hypothetical protein
MALGSMTKDIVAILKYILLNKFGGAIALLMVESIFVTFSVMSLSVFGGETKWMTGQN